MIRNYEKIEKNRFIAVPIVSNITLLFATLMATRNQSRTKYFWKRVEKKEQKRVNSNGRRSSPKGVKNDVCVRKGTRDDSLAFSNKTCKRELLMNKDLLFIFLQFFTIEEVYLGIRRVCMFYNVIITTFIHDYDYFQITENNAVLVLQNFDSRSNTFAMPRKIDFSLDYLSNFYDIIKTFEDRELIFSRTNLYHAKCFIRFPNRIRELEISDMPRHHYNFSRKLKLSLGELLKKTTSITNLRLSDNIYLDEFDIKTVDFILKNTIEKLEVTGIYEENIKMGAVHLQKIIGLKNLKSLGFNCYGFDESFKAFDSISYFDTNIEYLSMYHCDDITIEQLSKFIGPNLKSLRTNFNTVKLVKELVRLKKSNRCNIAKIDFSCAGFIPITCFEGLNDLCLDSLILDKVNELEVNDLRAKTIVFS